MAMQQRLLLLSLARIAVGCAGILAGLLFAARTLNWPNAWWFSGILLTALVVSALHLARVNPEIFVARRRIGAGTKGWDRVMIVLIGLGFTAIIWIAGFDHRWQWGLLPDWLAAVGYILLLAGVVIITLAQAVNRHFEPTVRLQSDRAHAVIDSGPYAIVRHPGYAGGLLIVVGMGLALGSGWAFVGVVATLAVLAIRTVLEERTLHDGLTGYTAYTQRVRYRWVPGVW